MSQLRAFLVSGCSYTSIHDTVEKTSRPSQKNWNPDCDGFITFRADDAPCDLDCYVQLSDRHSIVLELSCRSFDACTYNTRAVQGTILSFAASGRIIS